MQSLLVDEPVCFEAGVAPEDQPKPGDRLRVIPAGAGDGSVAEDTLVSCDGGTRFPLSALENLVPVEQFGDESLEKALAQWLTDEEGQYDTQTGWHVLHHTDDALTLVARTGRGDAVSFIYFESSRAGWEWAGSSSNGSCRMRVALPEGYGEVNWRLDKRFGTPARTDTELHLRVSERDCASGEAIGDRLLGPDLVETDSAVLVAFAAIVQYDGQDCQGNPWTRVTVTLSSPLGDRDLRDGLRVDANIADALP